MDRLAVDKMDLEEIGVRLLRAFRTGLLSMDLKGPVLGYAAALKRKQGPSVRQIELARKLVREIRYQDGTEPVDLIDEDDNNAGREVARDYQEF